MDRVGVAKLTYLILIRTTDRNRVARMKRIMMVAGLLAAVLVGCSGSGGGIDQDRVTRIVTALAADDMRGRDSFSPDGMRAAEFVAAEFTDIGLEPMEGQDDYLQRFSVWSVAPETVSVSLNGTTYPAEQIAASLSVEVIHWTQGAGPLVTVVGEDESLFQAFRRARTAGSDGILIVPTAQRDLFDRLRGYMSNPARITDLSTATNLVAVLSDVVEVRDFTVDATAVLSETPLVNVVGVIPGRRSTEQVLFGGHYDHIGIVTPVEGDSIANGANDDASGTTAVIELARHFRAMGRPERTLVFVAFAAEESGGFGSSHFAESVVPEQVVAMFNIEMIGKPAAEGPNSAWITGFDRSDFGAILQGAVAGTEYTFGADPYPDQNLFFRSDNAVFARKGIPAHSISTTPIDVDPDYHQVTDEVQSLDLEHMTNTIRAIAAGAATIVSGEATPSRIELEGGGQ